MLSPAHELFRLESGNLPAIASFSYLPRCNLAPDPPPRALVHSFALVERIRPYVVRKYRKYHQPSVAVFLFTYVQLHFHSALCPNPAPQLQSSSCQCPENDRHTPPQHALRPPRAPPTPPQGRSPHLQLRPHGLRLCSYRQFPYLCLPGRTTPLPPLPRPPRTPSNEPHRRGRSHHPERRRCRRLHPRAHRKIRPGDLRRYERAAS